jgi:UDP-2,3-diacylglucosamine hydrolase
MATYFISDVHLGLGTREQEHDKEDRLLSFFRSILPKAERLFILGDLFDLWFEYATVIPKGFFRTLVALRAFTERGIQVEFLAGNHDYWMGDFFSAELGVKLHFEPFEITLDRKRLLLHHGDGLIKEDVGYRLIKPVLRSKISITLYRWLHPDIGIRLARGSSRTSRNYTAGKKIAEDGDLVAFAADQIRHGIDIVIMGHQHHPVQCELEGGVYVNLGDWISHRTYAEMTNGSIALRVWNEGAPSDHSALSSQD